MTGFGVRERVSRLVRRGEPENLHGQVATQDQPE